MITKLLQRLCKNKFTTIADLQQALTTANKQALINANLYQILSGSLQLSQLRVRDIMVPKSKMVVIKESASFDEFLTVATTSAHSRFPVVDTDNKVKGVILAKDLLAFLSSTTEREQFDYKDYLREAIMVPEEKSLESLLAFFQQKRTHLMIVLDEYGEMSGLITLEDVLEQIVGEIDDEHDFEKDSIVDYGKGRFLIKGDTPLAEFNEYFATEFNTQDSETIAGFIVKEFGYIPEQLEEITIENYHFKILKSSTRKIYLVEVVRG